MRLASLILASVVAANVSLQKLPTARADEHLPPPGDGGATVYMKDGRTLHGSIIEFIPDDHVTVALSNRQTVLVRWDEIQRVDQTPTQVAPATPPPSGGQVWVHLDAPRHAVLQAAVKSGEWVTMCTTPCDRELPLAATYRITALDARPSSEFEIQAVAGDRVVIRAKGASDGMHVGGITMVVVSSVAMAVGALVGLLGLLVSAACDEGDCDGGAALGGGLLTVLVGGAGLAGGIVLLRKSGGTSYDVQVSNGAGSSTSLAPSRPSAVAGNMWIPEPTWRAPSSVERAIPSAPFVPLYTWSF